MAVAQQQTIFNLTAVGSSTFGYGCRILCDADLRVTVDGVAKTLGVDYAVSGIGAANGGNVIFSIAPVSGAEVRIWRSVTPTRTTDYQYAGNFQSPTVNADFDRALMAIQDMQNGSVEVANSLRVPAGETVAVLPIASVRRGRLLGFTDTETADPTALVTPDAAGATALDLDLRSVLDATKGAGQVGWSRALPYGASSIGGGLNALYQYVDQGGSQSFFAGLSSAQIADVQAGTLSLDLTAMLQSWATAIAGKKGYLPPGKYKMTAAVAFATGTTVEGAGAAGSMLYTALDIEQITGAGTSNVTFKGVGFYNTFPVSNVAGPTPTGTTTNGSPTITAVSSMAGLFKGMPIAGTGIPAGTYIHKLTGTAIYMRNSAGSAVNATSTNVATSLTTQFRQGQTKFHALILNGIRWVFKECYFKSAFTDLDYSPNNHAGVRFYRDIPGSFINSVADCWVDHGQVQMSTSDSSIYGSVIWSNPFDYSVALLAPNINCSNNSISAGQAKGGVWVASTAGEPSGSALHLISSNNIDSGIIWYSGPLIVLDSPIGVVIAANKLNESFQQGILTTGTANSVSIVGNSFFDNNLEGLGFSDIELAAPTGCIVSGNTFFQSNAKAPTTGYAIKELSAGANNVYSGNTINSGGYYQAPALSIATAAASGQYPKIFGNAGGSTETESIANAVTNTFTGTLTGCTTSPTGAVKWTRQGNLVTLTLPALTATSNSTACTITGMPAALWPAAAQQIPVPITDNNVGAMGVVLVTTAGVLTLGTINTGLFTNTNVKGCNGGNITYHLVS